MEMVMVFVARLITLVSFPFVCYRVLTIESRPTSTVQFVAEMVIVFVAMAITIRYAICEQEREENKKQNRNFRKAHR